MLAGLAAFGVAADEEVWAGSGEAEDVVAALEVDEGVGGVAGVVVALAHRHHRVAVIAVPKHEAVVHLEAVALGPSVERLGRVRRPPASAADDEVAAGATGRRQQQVEEGSHGEPRQCHAGHVVPNSTPINRRGS